MKSIGHWGLITFHVNEAGVNCVGEVSYSEETRPKRLKQIMEITGASELYYISTCNRAEFLLYSKAPLKIEHLDLPLQAAHIEYQLDKIISHLLRVAVGRDSVVIGENQILGQFKAAYDETLKLGLSGSCINSLIQLVLKNAKDIRTKVKIQNFPSSISTVAGKYLIDELQDKNSRILLVGYSETHQILDRFLKKWNYTNIFWTNRTDSHLRGLKNQVLWSDFQKGNLEGFDTISVATRSNEFLIGENILSSTRPKLLLDLSVPANADKTIVQKFDSKYVGIEELNHMLSDKKREAQSQLKLVDGYIELKSEGLLGELLLRSASEVFSNLVQEADNILINQIQDGLKSHFNDFDESSVKSIESWSRKLVKKITHQHLETLKNVLPANRPQ